MTGETALKVMGAIMAMEIDVRVACLGKDAVALCVEDDELCIYVDGTKAGEAFYAHGDRARRAAHSVFGFGKSPS